MVGTWCRSGFGRLKKTVRRSRPLMFVNELMHQPKFTGAICPSSRKLGRYMAKHIPLNHDGIVIELGGGTGVITQAILDHGVPADKLIVIEFSNVFAQHLQRRFPHLTIINGNAADLDALLPPDVSINAIVSSLPLISLPPEVRSRILHHWQTLLKDDGRAIQFTYNLRQTQWQSSLKACHYSSEIVWTNVPPARVMTFRFAA